MRKAYVFKERQRYSIRKYSFGAASVLIGASLMLGGHALAQEQANSTGSITDYEVTVNNSEAPQIDQATSEAVTDVLNEPASRSEAPRPKLASSEVASSEASSVVSSEVASLEVPAEVAHSASAVASVSRSEVATPRSEVSSVASSEVVSEINRSATSEVAEVRGTDREAVDTSLRTVLTNASQPGVDGPVTADGSLDIPSNGTYYFRRTTEIRTAPIMDIKPTFVFSAGDHVIYDKVLKKDNHQWISYIGYDYERYYADIAALKAENTSSTTEATRDETIPERGTYYFTKPADVKNQPSLTAKTEFNFDPGMSVNYDKIVSGDGYQWLSYLSYNGNRRYVAVAKLAQQESKPSGTINIENLSNLGFDVHITNVSGGDKAIQGVSVPVWTAKDGQDDLVWHKADRQSDGSYKVRINVNDHKAEAGEYIVHLYYVQDGKMVGIGGTSTTVPVQNATRHNLPASGSYTFTARTGIKTQPLVANPDVSYYDAGMSVNYDKVVNNDGYTWLSYLSYSGHRFYVAIAPTSVTKPVEQPVQPSTPSSGTYTFKERSSIKAEPSVASPELAYYDAGMSVNYDRLVTADGHTWLSYVSHGCNRRYIAIDGKATAVAQPASPSLAATGTYTFTKPSSIKAQPSVASPELAYYDKGMSVRYDKVLTADGHTWLSYVTYSGARRYVDIA